MQKRNTENVSIQTETYMGLLSFLPYGVLTKEAYLLHKGNTSSVKNYHLRILRDSKYIISHERNISFTKKSSGRKKDTKAVLNYYSLSGKGYNSILDLSDIRQIPWVVFSDRITSSIEERATENERPYREITDMDILSLFYPFGIKDFEQYNYSFPNQLYMNSKDGTLGKELYKSKLKWFTNYIKSGNGNLMDDLIDCDKVRDWNVKEICEKAGKNYDYVKSILYDEELKACPFPRDTETNGFFLSVKDMRQIMGLQKNDIHSHTYYNHAGIFYFHSKPYILYHAGKKAVYFGKRFSSLLKRQIVQMGIKMRMPADIDGMTGFILFYNSHDLVRQLKKEYMRTKDNDVDSRCRIQYKHLYMLPVINETYDQLSQYLYDPLFMSKIKNRYYIYHNYNTYENEEELLCRIDTKTNKRIYLGFDMDFCTISELYGRLRSRTEANMPDTAEYTIICYEYQKSYYNAAFRDWSNVEVVADDDGLISIIDELDGEES